MFDSGGAPSCCSAFNSRVAGVWFTIIGNGGTIIASTCIGTDFDSEIAVFTGSCGQLTCVDGNDQKCGSQSRLDFQSNQGQTYYMLVNSDTGASGNFALQIIG
jgi:hypothetical protein